MDDGLKFAGRRDRVLSDVIEPLCTAGMRKPKSMTKDEFEGWKHDLAESLAWLSCEWHDALRETIERNAEKSKRVRTFADGSPPRDIWPTAVAIRNWAAALSPCAGVSSLVGTYMRSRAGRDAWARSPFEASRLEVFLRERRRPPADHEIEVMIREEGRELAGRIDDTERRVAGGIASDAERRGLQSWARRREWLDHLINGDLDRCPELAR